MKFFSKSISPDQFWEWFASKSDDYLHFEKNQDYLFRQLYKKLTSVDKLLTFQFGPLENGQREFVISPDGVRKGVSAVKELVAAAPALPHWNIIAFKPVYEIEEAQYEGRMLSVRDVNFSCEQGEGFVDLALYIKNYNEKDKEIFMALAFIILDATVGEYNVLTKIAKISFHNLADKKGSDVAPIARLKEILDSLPSTDWLARY